MERGKKGKKSKKSNYRHGHFSDVEEPEYHVVDDHEEMFSVHIQPAMPLNADTEYADRNVPRSSSSHFLSSSGNWNTPPRCPPREFPFNPGPAVNRNLKPGRRMTQLEERLPAAHPRDQHTQLSQRFPPPVTNDFVNRTSALNLQKPCRRDGQKSTKNTEFSAFTAGIQSFESDSSNHTSLRYSLDLDTQYHTNKRAYQNLERSLSKRQHHEWPQTKEDFDQHDFVPMEKPQQTYHEEDWYVGPCNRAEAEHALHLVNKDGAFLVRDCSINTTSEPLVLVVYHDRKVYNVKIRFLESTSKYALGTGQRANDMFDSVADIIKFHSIFPIALINGKNMPASKYPGNCVLTCPVTKIDVDQLLG